MKYPVEELDPYSEFSPSEYIEEYYSHVGAENEFLLRFYHDVFSELPKNLTMLEVGGGPTVYQLFSASRAASEIVFTDYLESNLETVAQWVAGLEESVSWRPFASTVAKLEGGASSKTDVEAQCVEERTRAAIRQIIACNVLSGNLLEALQGKRFDVVSSGFCLECISRDEAHFVQALSNVSLAVAKRGYLVLTVLKNSSSYRVGSHRFPSFPVDSSYLRTILASLSFEVQELRETRAEDEQGYDGLIAVLAQRTAD
ncbi:MAG: hypothetical protein KDD69_02320 [Bdellovibrionales bacterium]|nr:hypothetical protein [Bdellovibrionales bacterium]